MEPGMKFGVFVDRFKELVLQMESIGESLDEIWYLVLLLGSLGDEYSMHTTILENTPNVVLAYAIQALACVESSGESSSSQEGAFTTKRKDFGNKCRFSGNSYYYKKPGHKAFECRKKRSDQGWRRAKRPTLYLRPRV
ncbi:hypothetical protein PC129_g20772 [Phytophthora cactorum]|uniref:Uncharacterized protein n=1 Tax=Phytophthora cactorum TaxID=29920 RepID=A0A329RLX6_9STRA|nr:hypothetical protein Pcac1_g27873 [Phytophthora cactorum]KAG2798358.1 hypothetical protein PC112_g21387 [Phytophthora cactorum]KAG2798389.1 hypothetical protein PC111_g20874 [Phytophthora cactorum]KAG2829276.1 hypothetical protein PC113_g21311 [Phytophthora cactorum]KAG2877371.1 hypothetical protein PC114_g23669 [Phytophthora cactorum]